jgi:hypothetical protein
LVVGIVLLFIGVAVSPSINCHVIKASDDQDIIDVTAEACGVKGFGRTTMQLSRQQYQDLEQYLDGFRARLNQTITKIEVILLFKDAVVELNKYHLLPRGMSVTKAQTLVTGCYLDSPVIQGITEAAKKKTSNNLTNTFCFIAGLTNGTEIFSLLLWSWIKIAEHMKYLVFRLPGALQIPWLLFLYFTVLGVLAFDYLRPVMAWSTIYITQGYGSLFTLGLNGKKQRDGSLDGKITGFTGIKLLLNWKIPLDYFYFGSAWKVQMSYA